MRSFFVHSITAALALSYAGVASAQHAPAKPNALPPPPLPVEESGLGIDPHYSRSKSADQNTAARQSIVQRLTALQRQLKDLDRAVTNRLSAPGAFAEVAAPSENAQRTEL